MCEQLQVDEYLKIYNIFLNLKFEGDPSDAFKMIQYKVLWRHTHERLYEMYRDLPQSVKDMDLVPRFYRS